MSNEVKQECQSRNYELMTEYNPKSPLAESYRTLRTNLRFLSPDNRLQTIAITSSIPGEGKSITVANLAISMVQDGQDVIIIDTDLRRPMQHRLFEVANYSGLSNILTNEIDLNDGLQETSISGLNIISSGMIPPNPAELLGSNKMEEVIKEAKGIADVVVIDCPPVIAVSDSRILTDKVDGVILVVASHETNGDAVVKSKEMLEQVQANIIGTILTKYPVQESSGYYSGYYQYY
ncbi:CpsD/CapB family tyrosine-protein kinase [Selenihalanaerobacter shriftii]|uniref:non-specific protein-tyrosine kinase n=1 Tax=Selenihalanaerobacter shriftii TaxID=142842 RepID=A0A1T4KVK6_9FIRM|nr:CpsD/CapB family tyrosine-protein kinase [Selenihalanaerobacter shriftii]SJZ46459.1 capsular exopolysaccharide family [Selenihalanaerobacter shriftii]